MVVMTVNIRANARRSKREHEAVDAGVVAQRPQANVGRGLSKGQRLAVLDKCRAEPRLERCFEGAVKGKKCPLLCQVRRRLKRKGEMTRDQVGG